jgi:phenylacetic acid degradation operon negative regulatory protein
LTEFGVSRNAAGVQPTAKSLVLDLLSSLRGGAMPVRALVAAGALFEIAENGMRVELARLVARGLVERNDRGLYRLAPASAAIQDRVASWMRLEERTTAWDGAWTGVHTAGLRADRTALRRHTRAFAFLGFRELAPGLWIRPANLRGRVDDMRRQLQALGLDRAAPVFTLADLDDDAAARARTLWDARALRAEYGAMRRALAASVRHVRGLPEPQAMVETFLLGGQGIRLLAHDPMLPEPLVPARERRALVQAMQRYDRIGKRCWRAFMERHDAPTRTSPVNLRLVATADAGVAAMRGIRRSTS